MAPKNYETKILKTNKKDKENSKDRQTRTRRGCYGTTNTYITRKPDNTFQGIQNKIPKKSDNPLKGMQNLVPNGIWSQWPRGLTVPT